MATYGAPIPSDVVKSKIDGVDYYTKTSTRLSTDGKTEKTILYAPEQPIFGTANYIPAATTTDGGKTWNYAKYKQGDDIPSGKKVGDEIFGNQAKKSLEGGALKTNSNNAIVTALKKAGVPPEQQKQAALNQNTASPTGDPNKPAEGGNIDQAGIDKLKGAAGEYKGRKDYPKNLKYPVNMNAELQDCIKFQIIEYKASRLGLSNQNPTLRTNSGTGRTLLSSIFLPMPSGGISDRNNVSWGSGSLDLAAQTVSGAAIGFLEGGAKGATDAAKNDIDLIMGKNGKDMLGELVKAKSLEAALGTNNLLSRLSGLAVNPSLELLFEGPSLREFSFSFKMTPRSKKEAQEVRSIIRTFKQAMSVKRSESVLLLKAPHTFRISYITSTQDHPYLNRFKECALTNCSVNYTPDGQYMSYDDSNPNGRSMTAYELSLSFNELEPIFDDDYDKDFDGVDKQDALPFTNIGY